MIVLRILAKLHFVVDAVYCYRLISEEGAELGSFLSPRLAFQVGEEIGQKGGKWLTVVRVTEAESQEKFRAYLVVKAPRVGSDH